MVSNPAGTESWNILKSEIDSVINRYIPMKKQRKLFKKKHLSKEALKRLDIIPVPEIKFYRPEGEWLGQLVVTPEVVDSKINNLKDNKSPGVDGKILKETVEQISMPLAHVFNMSLQDGIVPLEWKEANFIPFFKNVQETSPYIIDQSV